MMDARMLSSGQLKAARSKTDNVAELKGKRNKKDSSYDCKTYYILKKRPRL